MSIYSDEKVFGFLVPEIFIDRVTLSNTGMPAISPLSRKSDPHILQKDQKASQSTTKFGGLKVVIDLAVQDKIDENMISEWFENHKYREFLQIYLHVASDNRTINQIIHQNRYSVPNLAKIAPSTTIQRKIFGSSKGESLFKSQFKTTDSLGNDYVNINLQHTFNFDREPADLAIFAYCHFDLDALIKSLGIDSDILKGGNNSLLPEQHLLFGPLSNLSIIKNGSFEPKSFRFLDDERKEWKGPVHSMASRGLKGWMNGWSHGDFPEQKFLQYLPVATHNVSDFRIFESLGKIETGLKTRHLNPTQLDLSFVESGLSKIIQRLGSQKEVEITENIPMFSQMWVSKNSDRTCGFLFGVDFGNVLEQNSVYSPLIKVWRQKPEMFADYTAYLSILNVDIFRRKVKLSRDTSESFNQLKKTPEENYAPEFVLDENGEKQQYQLFNGEDFGVTRNNKFITFSDPEIAKKQSGNYQYMIEITFMDTISNIFSDRVTTLEDGRNFLLKYYAEASRIGMSKVSLNKFEEDQGFVSAHVDLDLTKKKISDIKGNYDPILNRFTRDFITSQRGIDYDDKLAFAIIYDYIDNISFLAGIPQQELEAEQKKLYTIAGIKTGNPRGILTLIKLYDDLISQMRNMIYLSSSKTKDLSAGEKQKSKSGTNARIFTIRKEFEEVVDINLEKGYSHDYLGPAWEAQANTMLSLSANQYITRVEKETKRFFKTVESNIQINASGKTLNPGDNLENQAFSYLTPFTILNPYSGEKLDLANTRWDDSRFLDKELKVIFSNLQNLGTEKSTHMFTGKGEILDSFEFVHLIFPSLLKTSISSGLKVLADAVNKSSYTTETVGSTQMSDPLANVDLINTREFEMEVVDKKELSILLRLLQLQILNDGMKVLGKNVTSIKDFDLTKWSLLSGVFNTLPNQIKALFLSSVASNSNSLVRTWSTDPFTDIENGSAFRLHCMNIAKVEYLKTFVKSKVTKQDFIKSPEWATLTSKTISDITKARAAGEDIIADKLLCRIIPTMKNVSYDLPIYNKHFILDVSTAGGIRPFGQFMEMP